MIIMILIIQGIIIFWLIYLHLQIKSNEKPKSYTLNFDAFREYFNRFILPRIKDNVDEQFMKNMYDNFHL
jgi:hypothetical protein